MKILTKNYMCFTSIWLYSQCLLFQFYYILNVFISVLLYFQCFYFSFTICFNVFISVLLYSQCFYFSFTIFSMFFISVLLYVSMFFYFRTFLYISITIVLGTTCARPYLQADYMISEKVTHSPISAIHMARHGHSTDRCISLTCGFRCRTNVNVETRN